MTQKELRHRIAMVYNNATDVESVLSDINQHVKEVIGEDEYCPCRWLDCPITRINEIKAEQRKRANFITYDEIGCDSK